MRNNPQNLPVSLFLRRARERQVSLDQTFLVLQQTERDHQTRVAALQQSREDLLTTLTEHFLPELNATVLAQIAQKTGYGRFQLTDPLEQMAQERHQLHQRLSDIEADPLYQKQDELTQGVRERQAELAPTLETLQQAVARYETNERFMDLFRCGYDTPTYLYKGQWWTLRFYRNWEQGDIIAEAYGEQTFAAVREAYVGLRKGLDNILEVAQPLQEQLQAIQSIIAARSQCLEQLETLAERTLTTCRQTLREHLAYIDRSQLAQRADSDPRILALIKQLHGREKQIEYLNELTQRYLQDEHQRLRKASQKLQKKVAKYSRSKYQHLSISAQDAEDWLQETTAKDRARSERFWRHYQQIEAFDAYDRYDYSQDWLWWFLISQGRIQGDWIPEVRDWQLTHPGEPFPTLSQPESSPSGYSSVVAPASFYSPAVSPFSSYSDYS